MRRLLRKRRGFPVGVTLIELMIVIALIGLLAALATPTIRRTQERAAARAIGSQIANDLRTARNQAMSRGEALWVEVLAGNGTEANRGSIRILRTDLRCDSGEVPAGIACPDGTEARRARNCRQERVLDTANPVLESDFSTFSGSAQIAGTTDNIGLICFNPDGRVLDGQGNIIPGDGQTCDGENLVIYTASINAQSTDVSAAADCNGTADERELVDLYRVVVPYNGSIKMGQ